MLIPLAAVAWRSVEDGPAAFLAAITYPESLSAMELTFALAIGVVAINALMGSLIAWVLVRDDFPGKSVINALIDLPFALSPVVIGLSLILVYGKNGWLGGILQANGIQVIFALPSMILATIFVSLPFVVREVIPVLREIGTDQEEAAYTLGASPWRTFWRVTLPAIRWGVIYGVILTTARALGEFGAVSIVSGKISGKTETLTLNVEDRYQEFDLVGAYTASIVLALMAVAVLLAMNVYQSGRFRGNGGKLVDDAAPGVAAGEVR